MENKLNEQKIKEIASIAWKCAANAHRMYPNNKHTFAEHWNDAKFMYNDYIKEEILENPYNCFGRKPHPMDFEDEYDFRKRLANWEIWQENNDKRIAAVKAVTPK